MKVKVALRIKVAVGLIFDEQQRLLITRRPWHKPHGGFWEFPGGKLEAHEDPKAALSREIEEETGLQVIASEYLGDVLHDYSDTAVQLIVFVVRKFIGVPLCRESQLDLRWVKHDELANYQFPEANLAIIQLLETMVIERETPN